MECLRKLSLHISESTSGSPKLHQGHQLPPIPHSLDPAINVVCHRSSAPSPKMPTFPFPCTGEKLIFCCMGKKIAPKNEVIGE